MKYMGGKSRIGKYIVPIMLRERKPGQYFVEPFCGGCNITVLVDGPRIAGDVKKELIAFWRKVSKGWTPKLIRSKKEYDYYRAGNGDPAQRVWAATGASFRGVWFGSFVGYGPHSCGQDYQTESLNWLKKHRNKLRGVKFYARSYDDLRIPPRSIIYCDPPYKNTRGYESSKINDFDHAAFFDWCRKKAKEGHVVFVSEYEAPSDFVCVWQKEKFLSLSSGFSNKTVTEKLFLVKK